MVTYIRSDLDFILAQIKIAEAHASGQPLYGPGGLIPTYNLSWGLRTVDGTYNNLLPGRSEWGASDNPFPTLTGTEFRTIMVDPDGPGGSPPVPVTYQPGVDNDGPGPAGPGDVFDPYVRTISNLIVDQTLANPSAILTALQRAGIVAPADEMTVLGTISAAYEAIEAEFNAVSSTHVAYTNAATTAAANPSDAAAQTAAADALAAYNAAIAALNAVRGPLDALLATNGVVLEGDNVQITNVAPDEGLSAPFNSWFTLFGQFFDHGLDLVAKGEAGTVFIPLMPDDPLYVPGGTTNFMVLTRATRGPDGPINNTTPFVDQNQTYASHASHQVFLRAYEFNGAGDPVNTGKLIEGSNGGMATWADMKAQAHTLLGLNLTDQDVGNVPLLATDEYGNFIPGPNGFPQVVMAGPPQTLVEGDPSANGGLGISLVGAVRTGHAFLADIAHSAVPNGLQDGDIEVGLGNGDGSATDGFYDNELLDAHFMAGDGRANENIGLTAVHHVFHSEHNRLVDHTKAVVIADAQAILANGGTQADAVAFLNEWLIDDVATVPVSAAGLVWDGERLFQAAKFGTEMQYQHLVFEEFARKIQPSINAFIVPDGYDASINPSIVAEFAHVVYRFGHSMLTENIDRFDPTMTPDQISLIEGFLNPLEFQNNGGTTTVDANIAAGAIVRGMTRQEGNQIDEFVTSALRNNLLGLPLDLATINLARGRDTGVPSLNAARREFYEASDNNILLKPYESWTEFASHLKNEASIINFIAAYGDHDLITSQSTIDGKRDAALTIITGVSVGGLTVPADRLAFLNASGAYAGAVPGSLGGLENVDLWIGGLAEETMAFGGMLGSTFNFVFEVQMESLQNGDRFYYLQRLDGLHLFGEMEANSFASLIMRNTDATHLPSDVFSTPGLILEINQAFQANDLDGDGILESADPVGSGLLTQLVIRDNPLTPGADSNYLRYTGGDHIVMGGTDGDDIMIAGIGDDTLHGDAGNDRLEGGFGNDIINGGAGDDIIMDSGGDDNIKAGAGNDAVHGGPGLDLVLAGAGNDFVVLGTDDLGEVFGGEGNDFIHASPGAERILGNEGDDWLEGGAFSGAPGDNFDEIFARDQIRGNDVFIGTGGFDEFIGEGGDDIFVGSLGRNKSAGMSGFDWQTYKDNINGVNADLSIPILFDAAPTIPANAALDEFDAVEGLSGTQFDDILRGSNEDATTLLPFAQGGSGGGLAGSFLDASGIALIAGLQNLVGVGVNFFGAGDIILGGAGSDIIEGQGGDDILDGDRWLNVEIGVFSGIGADGGVGTELFRVNNMSQLVSQIFSGTLNPGQLRIMRTIEEGDGSGVDVAVFSDVRANYDITDNGDGSYTVVHARGTLADGTDILRNFEFVRFSDGLGGTTQFAMNAINTALAQSDAFATGEAGVLNGNVFADNGGGADATIPPGGLLSVAAVNGSAAAVGVATLLASGATLTLNANGTFSYNPNLAFRSLPGPLSGASNLTATDSFTYTLSGGNTATVTLTINGQDTTLDVLQGTAGNDSLWGGIGNDTLNGLGGIDTATYALAAAGVSANLNGNVAANDGNGGVDTFNSIENLTGSNFNDILIGNALSNVLNGGTGADTLVGLAGNDILIGGTGAANTLQGGDGDDLYVISANDSVVEFAGQGIDTIETTLNSFNQRNNVENLTFVGAGAFTGNGNALDNVITGAAGADVLAGRAGNDTLIGAGGLDTASYAAATGGVVVRLDLNVTSNDGEGGSDILSSIENAIGSDFIDLMIGNNDANVLTGGAGGDILLGNGGNDTLIGGAGAANQLQGGTGDDTYIVTAADTVVELAGEGIDTIQTSQASRTLGANIENLTYTGGGTFTGVGNALNNVITGGNGIDTLTGGGGDDTLIGNGGNDIAQLQGLAGQYTVTAIAGGYMVSDNVAGRDGVDTLLSVERVRYSNGTIVNLSSLVVSPAPTVAAKTAEAQVIPTAPDESLLSKLVTEDPWILPGTPDESAFTVKMAEPQVLPELFDLADLPGTALVPDVLDIPDLPDAPIVKEFALLEARFNAHGGFGRHERFAFDDGMDDFGGASKGFDDWFG